MLYFYFSFLLIGIGLILIVSIIEKRKNKTVQNYFIRDQLLTFLKMRPWAHKIGNLEEELREGENLPDEELRNDLWKAKYQKLDALLREKSAALAKVEEALNHEIKNRSEFENFRSLLQEEIEKGRERRRQLQAELNSLKTENENLRSQLTELEKQATSPVVVVPHTESIS